MQKFITIGMVLMAIVMGVNFTSCKPDNNEEEPTKKLVKIRYINDEKILKYDDQGHLSEYSYIYDLGEIGTFIFKYSFVWNENSIDITFDRNGLEQEKCTLLLENGLASGIVGNAITFDSTFKYNSSDRLIEHKNYSGTHLLEWNDDKLITSHSNHSEMTENNTYTYENNYTTKGYNPIIPYLEKSEYLFVAHPELAGLATQKLFDTHTNTYTLNDTTYTYSDKFLYEFDADGYVNKVIVKHNEEDCEHIVSEYTFVWE